MPLPWKKERHPGVELGPELKAVVKQLLKEAKKVKDKADLSEQLCKRLLNFPDLISSTLHKSCQDVKEDVACYLLHGSQGPRTLCAFACWLLEDFSVFHDSELTKRLLLEACIGTVGILTSLMPHYTSAQIYSIVTSSPRLLLAMGKFINHVHLLGYGGATPSPHVKEMHAAVYICLGFLFYGVKARELHRSMYDDVAIRLEQIQADSHQILDRDMRFLIQAILLSINCPKKYPYTNCAGDDVSHMCHIVASMCPMSQVTSQVYTCTIPKLSDASALPHTSPFWTSPIQVTASDVCETLCHMQSVCKPADLLLTEPRMLATICMLLAMSTRESTSDMASSCCTLLLHMVERCEREMACALQLCTPQSALLDALHKVHDSPVCHNVRHTVTSLIKTSARMLESGKLMSRAHKAHFPATEKDCGFCSLFRNYFLTIRQLIDQDRSPKLYILPALNSIPSEFRPYLVNLVEKDETLLSCASSSDQHELVKTLVESFYADLELPVRTRQREVGTVLHLAVDAQSLKSANLLLNNGACVNSSSSLGDTPLGKACAAGSMEMVWLLLRYRADVHATGRCGRTPLMMSAHSSGDQVARALLRFDASVRDTDSHGNTSLHYAARQGNVKMFEVILRAGCDPMTLNCDGDHPLTQACLAGQEEMVVFLFQSDVYPPEWKAPAFALLGTHFAGDIVPPKLSKAMKYWNASLKFTKRYPQSQGQNKVSHDVYRGAADIQSFDDLKDKEEDYVFCVMESLHLRERLLGKKHPKQHELMRLVAKRIHAHEYFTDTMRILTLALKRWHSSHCCKPVKNEVDTGATAQLGMDEDDQRLKCLQDISYLGHLAYRISEVEEKEDVKEMFECCMTILIIIREHLKLLRIHTPTYEAEGTDSTLTDVVDTFFEGILGIINCTLKLTVGSMSDHRNDVTKEIERIITEDVTNSCERSLLHVTLKCGPRSSEYVPVGRCTDYYPNPELVQVLLECGADVSKPDNKGDTPLHVCTQQVQRHLFRAASGDLRKCIEICLHFKPHLDFRNNAGARLIDELGKIDKNFTSLQVELNLQCLSAVCILKHGVPYNDCLPERLKSFVQRH